MRDRIDQRALCAVRFLDAETRTPVARAFNLRAEGTRWARNARGFHVLTEAPGFGALSAAFAPVDAAPPPPRTLEVEVIDPTGLYVPRRFTLTLPRAPLGPANTRGEFPEASLFAPTSVSMYPSTRARVMHDSAVVVVGVADRDGVPIPGAVVRVFHGQDDTLANERGRGVAWLVGPRGEEHAEALVAVTGLSPMTPNATAEGGVASTTLEVRVVVAALTGMATRDARPVDPDEIVRRWSAPTTARAEATGVSVVSRGVQSARLTVELSRA